MQNYYRYLPLSEQDEQWGLSVLNIGCTSIRHGEQYPSKEHPAHHYFNWNKGRILNEYQLVYIASGEGIFETPGNGQQAVRGGAIMLLFPGVWHRYRPDIKTGWDEYWIGFKGPVAENIFKRDFFQREEALFKVGYHDSIIALFQEMIDETRKENPGYQPLVSGALLHLLGKIFSVARQEKMPVESHVQSIMNKAIVLLRTKVDEKVEMNELAGQLQVSYAWFRKTFKAYTGMAPNQYLLQLKVEKAKQLLNDPAKSIKEIGFELNFDYPLNFSKFFKDKVGLSPLEYRSKILKNDVEV